MAQKWREENPGAPPPNFTPKSMKAKKISHLPKQDNYCDCGLFTLTYIHFFTYGAPEAFKFGMDLQRMGGGTPPPSPSAPRHTLIPPPFSCNLYRIPWSIFKDNRKGGVMPARSK